MSLGQKNWEKMVRDVMDKVRNRTHVLNPFRLDAKKHIYDVALPDHLWIAVGQLRTLASCTDLFRTTSYAETTFGLDGEVFKIRVSLPRQIKNPLDIITPWANIHPKARDYIMLWTRRHNELKRDEELFSDVLGTVSDTIGTWGQVGRVWPEFAPFFPSVKKSLYLKRRAQSRVPFLPSSVTIEVITQMREVITEAVMLPQHEFELHGVIPAVFKDI